MPQGLKLRELRAEALRSRTWQPEHRHRHHWARHPLAGRYTPQCSINHIATERHKVAACSQEPSPILLLHMPELQQQLARRLSLHTLNYLVGATSSAGNSSANAHGQPKRHPTPSQCVRQISRTRSRTRTPTASVKIDRQHSDTHTKGPSIS
jgi:hypothetical protein